MTKDNENKSGGVFITRGMKLMIPVGGLVLSLNNDKMTEVRIKVSLDVTDYWLDIAMDHLLKCEEYNTLLDGLAPEEGKKIGPALESSFSHGMQAICASCFALDAFYASTVDIINIPDTLRHCWRKNRTSRPKQIAQVIMRGFAIGKDSLKQLQGILTQIYSLRDKAVHPTASMCDPVLHSRLNVGVEPRFVIFGYGNAKNVIGLSLSIIGQLSRRPRKKYSALVSYCSSIKITMDRHLDVWEENYGSLFDRAP